MMLPAPQIAFLSLARARHPSAHRALNQWHQLDHRPENLALEGVAWGERFVLPPEAAAQSDLGAGLEPFDYANIYWFDEPHPQSIRTWAEFAEQSFREGRRPDVDLVDRAYMDFFRLAGTAVSPGFRMNPRSLCFRPGTGLLLWLMSLPADLDRSQLHEHHRWELDSFLPALAAVPGVATAWCLQNDPDLAPASWAARESASGTDGSRIMRAVLASTEIDDPSTVMARIRSDEHAYRLRAPGTLPRQVEFSGALETITPWQWSWFNEGDLG